MLLKMLSVRNNDSRVVAPVVALSHTGERLAIAEANAVASCAAIDLIYASPLATQEDVCKTLAATSSLVSLIADGEVPFIPHGRAHDRAREASRIIGFSEQTATVVQRFHLYGFTPAPPGAVVANLTEGLPFAALTLALIRDGQVDIPILRYRWAMAYLAALAEGGVPIQERPPSQTWIN